MSELDNIKVGDKIPISPGVEKKLTQNMLDNMKFYEELNPGKNAIYNGKITRDFEHWLLNYNIKKEQEKLEKERDELKEKIARVKLVLE